MTPPRPQLSLPALKTLRGGLPAAAPLGLALAAALVGHGLLLAHNSWRRSPAKPQVLTAEDTTPELLRFSRRMPQEVAATTIPLPPATALPPPPPDLLGPLPTKNAAKADPAKSLGRRHGKARRSKPRSKERQNPVNPAAQALQNLRPKGPRGGHNTIPGHGQGGRNQSPPHGWANRQGTRGPKGHQGTQGCPCLRFHGRGC
jgi:hypothetical protein